jgi:hypothetical protein
MDKFEFKDWDYAFAILDLTKIAYKDFVAFNKELPQSFEDLPDDQQNNFIAFTESIVLQLKNKNIKDKE